MTYIHTDIPAGVTIDAYRRSRPAKRGAFLRRMIRKVL